MAAVSEEKAEGSIAASTGSGSGASKVLVALTGVNLVATMGMVAILFISFQKEKKHAAVEDIAAHAPIQETDAEKEKAGGGHGAEGQTKRANDFGKMVTLDQFTVNLSTPGSAGPKFVRVNISLEAPTEDVESEIQSKMPQVRNAIIDLFNSKRPADLANAEGRDYLKEEIKNALNTFLVNGKVKGVFFTNFALAS